MDTKECTCVNSGGAIKSEKYFKVEALYNIDSWRFFKKKEIREEERGGPPISDHSKR